MVREGPTKRARKGTRRPVGFHNPMTLSPAMPHKHRVSALTPERRDKPPLPYR